jgi:hypothetical protein
MDTDAIWELDLFIDNDGDLYRQQTQPIQKNLITKLAKGVYDKDKAVKLWMYLVDSGAKKYAREHGSPDTAWNIMFPKTVRLEVAKAQNEKFLSEAVYGGFNKLLPKKYQNAKIPRPAAGGKRRHTDAEYTAAAKNLLLKRYPSLRGKLGGKRKHAPSTPKASKPTRRTSSTSLARHKARMHRLRAWM